MMKAVRFHEYGGPHVLRIENVERPHPGTDEVLVRVAATAFNPADVMLRSGERADIFPLKLPHIPGYDLAGVIERLGRGVTTVAIGDPVVAFLPPTLLGGAAEYAVAPAALLAAAPTTIPLADAAGLPSAGITAWQAVFEHGELKSGQRVLVNGAGSVVGGLAVQLAVTAGAEVTGFAGTRSLDRVKNYGASLVIDYTSTPPAKADVGGFDLVFNVAPTPFVELAQLVKTGGRLVSANSPVDDNSPELTAIRMRARPDADQLARLVAEIDAGRLSLHIGDRRSFEDMRAVHVKHLPGKTILIPTAPSEDSDRQVADEVC